MIFAITSSGNSKTDMLDSRFGRCHTLVFYDNERGNLEFLPNPFRDEEEGVGPNVVRLIHSKGAGRIVSGSFGLKIKSLLDSHHIQMIIPEREDLTVSEILVLIDHGKKSGS